MDTTPAKAHTKRSRRRWTAAENAQLLAFAAQCRSPTSRRMSWKRLAAHFPGRSPAAVKQHLQKLEKHADTQAQARASSVQAARATHTATAPTVASPTQPRGSSASSPRTAAAPAATPRPLVTPRRAGPTADRVRKTAMARNAARRLMGRAADAQAAPATPTMAFELPLNPLLVSLLKDFFVQLDQQVQRNLGK